MQFVSPRNTRLMSILPNRQCKTSIFPQFRLQMILFKCNDSSHCHIHLNFTIFVHQKLLCQHIYLNPIIILCALAHLTVRAMIYKRHEIQGKIKVVLFDNKRNVYNTRTSEDYSYNASMIQNDKEM